VVLECVKLLFWQDGVYFTLVHHLLGNKTCMNRDLLTDDEMTDVEAWARFRKGEEMAFEWLYRRYFKSLAGYGLKLTANMDAVEDAIHDLFMDLWRRRAFLAEVTNPRFYLFRSLRNQLTRNSRHDLLG